MNQPDNRVEPTIEKKPYEKPEVVYRAPLEAMASDCGPGGTNTKNPGGGVACDSNPHS